MRETKVQKIARLEKKIEEQKKEMTEIKKDRKRLNYTVDKLKRQNKKLSAQSSKEDIERIRELDNQIEELKSQIEELKQSIETINNEKFTPINNSETDVNSEYRIFITWVESSNVDLHKIELLEKAFENLFLPKIGQFETKFPLQTEHTIEYRFKGSYEGYKMLKRAFTAYLKSLGNNAERHIEIHGEKIEE